MAGILSWWDGVELWLSGLGFVLQTIIVMPVVLLLAYGIAWVVDRVLGTGIGMLRFIRHDVGAGGVGAGGVGAGAGGVADVGIGDDRRDEPRVGRRLMNGMPRSRVTLALVALMILVLVAWLLNR